MPITRSKRVLSDGENNLDASGSKYTTALISSKRSKHGDEKASQCQDAEADHIAEQEQAILLPADMPNDALSSSAGRSSSLKMPVKRRVTFSPSTGAEYKRFRTASARQARGSGIEDQEPVLPLTPLRSVLAARVEKLLRSSPSAAEVAARHAAPDVTPFDSLMVVDAQALDSAIADMYTQGPTSSPESPSRRDRVLQVVTKQWEQERDQLERTVGELSDETHQVKTQLKSLQLDLQGLIGGSRKSDLRHLRRALHAVRDALLKSVPDVATNDMLDMLRVCAASVAKADVQDARHLCEKEEQAALIAELYAQIDALLDRLAQSELRCGQNDEQRLELIRRYDLKDEESLDLKDSIQSVLHSKATFEQRLRDRSAQLLHLERENEDLCQSLNRLKHTLHDYRLEEARLQNLIIRMEAEHTKALSKASAQQQSGDRLDAQEVARSQQLIKDLQGRLENEIHDRKLFQQETQEDQRLIHKLEAELREARQQLYDASEQREAERVQLVAETTAMTADISHLTNELKVVKQHYSEDSQQAATQRQELEASVAILTQTVNEQVERIVQILREKDRLVQRYELELGQYDRTLVQTPSLQEQNVAPISAEVEEQWFSLIKKSKQQVESLYRQNQEQDEAIVALRKRDDLLTDSITALLCSIDSSLDTISDSRGDVQAAVKAQRGRFAKVRADITASLARGRRQGDRPDDL